MNILIDNIDKQLQEVETVWLQTNQKILSVKSALEVLKSESNQLKGRKQTLLEMKELILKEQAEEKIRVQMEKDKPAPVEKNNK